MGAEHTGPDAIRCYLTGATGDGAGQHSPALSLGGYRSGALDGSLTVHRHAPNGNYTVDHVSGQNGPGVGTISAESVSALAWTAPGGSKGTSVTVANGETVALQDGTDTNAYVVVTRTSAYELGGSETIQLLDTVNNVVGGSNFSEAESTAGAYKYRAVMFRLMSDDIGAATLSAWMDDGYDTDVSIAVEAVSGDSVQTIADEDTAPSGLSWVSPTTEGTALSLGTLSTEGDMVALWIRRECGAASSANPLVQTVIRWKASGTSDVYGTLRGVSRIAEAGLAGYLLWAGMDAEPDTSAAADETFASLPHTTTLTLTANHDWHLRTAARNSYGLVSPATASAIIRVAADGSQSADPPNTPTVMTGTAYVDGELALTGVYHPEDETAAANRADEWAIWVTATGIDPDPSSDEPTDTEAMIGGGGPEDLSWISETLAASEGAELRWIVKTRRNDGDSETPDYVYSTNSTVSTTLAEWWGPTRPDGAASIGEAVGVPTHETPPDETVFIDEANNVRWVVSAGEVALWADTVLVWRLIGDSEDTPRNGLHTHFTREYSAVSGTGTGAVEVLAWEALDKRLALNVEGQRVMVVDVTDETISLPLFRPAGALYETRSTDPTWARYDAVCLQYWDATVQTWVTGASVAADGTLSLAAGIPWWAHEDQAAVIAV